MIATADSTPDFCTTVRNLTEGPARASALIDWIASCNLPTEDPLLAAFLMEATAAANLRVEKPVYHVAIFFHQDDVTPRAMEELIADRLLTMLRLTDHQALLMAHADPEHPQMHLLANRIHPMTYKAWDRWHDWTTTRRTLRQLERELCLHQLPLLRPQPADSPDGRPRLTRGEFREGRRTGREPLVEQAHRNAADLCAANSWEDLSLRLATHGLHYERRGQNLVFTDGARRVKASRVDRDLSFVQLQHRLGLMPERPAPTSQIASD